MPRRLAQQWMTLSDLEWPFHGSSAYKMMMLLAELNANVSALCTSSTLKSTSSTSRAISAIAELLLFLLFIVID